VNPILFFVMPVFGRHELAKLCMTQLRWTCNRLDDYGIHANAVVVGHEEELLEHSRELGFWTVRQDNEPLGRKFNDGFEAAYVAGADYVVPCGSDNWVHPSWISRLECLPEADEVVCHRQVAIVHESGNELGFLRVGYGSNPYDAGDGIRIFPMKLFRRLGYRPAVDHRNRAIDTSIVERLRRFAAWQPKYRFHDVGYWSVIGFQSHDVQLNDYVSLVRQFGEATDPNPWAWLAEHYPADDVRRMQEYFETRRAAHAHSYR